MKFIVSILICLSAYSLSIAQVRFNILPGPKLSVATDVLQTQDGYIELGRQVDSGIYFAKYDVNGDLVFRKRYIFDQDAYGGTNRSFIQASNGYTMVGVVEESNAKYSDIYLIRFDIDGDTLWRKVFLNSQTFESTPSVIVTTDGGYAIVNSRRYFNANGTTKKDVISFHKIDSLGTVIYSKEYSDGNYTRGYNIEQTSDGYFISAINSDATQTVFQYPYLLKIDTNYNKVWDHRVKVGGYYPMNAIQTADKGYLLYGGRKINGSSTLRNGVVIKLDSNRITEWEYTTPDSLLLSALTDGFETLDGYVCVGVHQMPDVQQNLLGWILKLNKDGSKLWERFPSTNLPLEMGTSHNVSSAVPTNDGGIFMGGTGFDIADTAQPTMYSKAWLVKTDSYGCYVENCQTTGIYQNKIENINIYPNPVNANGKLFFDLEDVMKNETRCVIYSIEGRIIAEEKLTEPSLDLSTYHIKPGLYLVRVIQAGRSIVAKKIVVQ